MNPKEQTVVEHIQELRNRLVVCAVVFMISLFAGF
ncbi:twin-arginine translocase subunit TatC, partial [Butyricicoccus sp. 1XD8-22]